MMNKLHLLRGYHLIVNNAGSRRKRTWKERLFSFPWRPFEKYGEFEPMIKDGESFMMANIVVMNQKTFDWLKKELAEEYKPGALMNSHGQYI